MGNGFGYAYRPRRHEVVMPFTCMREMRFDIPYLINAHDDDVAREGGEAARYCAVFILLRSIVNSWRKYANTIHTNHVVMKDFSANVLADFVVADKCGYLVVYSYLCNSRF